MRKFFLLLASNLPGNKTDTISTKISNLHTELRFDYQLANRTAKRGRLTPQREEWYDVLNEGNWCQSSHSPIQTSADV